MSLMLGKTYEAFKAAGAPDDKASAAAEEIASYDGLIGDIKLRFSGLEGKVLLIQWMVTFNLAISVALLWKLFS